MLTKMLTFNLSSDDIVKLIRQIELKLIGYLRSCLSLDISGQPMHANKNNVELCSEHFFENVI